MVLQSISNRGTVLRDSLGGQYNVPAYGELVVSDSLLTDSAFLRFLRFRIRDLVVITARPPDVVLPANLGSLTAYDGRQIYLDLGSGVKWHFVYNANSVSTYKWEFLGGPPLKAEVLTAEQIGSASVWANLATDGPAISAPRAGDYDARLAAVTTHTAATCNAQATVEVGNVDGTGALLIHESVDDKLSGSVIKRLAGVSSAGSVKARYYSNTTGQLPTFSHRTLEMWPVRIS